MCLGPDDIASLVLGPAIFGIGGHSGINEHTRCEGE